MRRAVQDGRGCSNGEGRVSMVKFSDEWKVRENLPGLYLPEQNNCTVDSGEICRNFRILGAQQISQGKWKLFRALDDDGGFHSGVMKISYIRQPFLI